MEPTAPTEPPLDLPGDDVCRSSDPELSAANLAALQEEIHEMENPNFAAQKLKVRELYDRGVPFFTKSAMKELKDQIDAVNAMAENGRSTDGQQFVFSSITGQTVERAVMKGLTHSRQFGKEIVLYVLLSELKPSQAHLCMSLGIRPLLYLTLTTASNRVCYTPHTNL